MVALLKHYGEGPVSAKHISEKERISIDYIEQLFIRLKKCGFVKSVRGPGGGFLLAKAPFNIKIGDILKCVGESIALTPCILMDKKGCYNCPLCGRCEVQRFFEETTTKLKETMDSKSLLSLLNKSAQSRPIGKNIPGKINPVRKGSDGI